MRAIKRQLRREEERRNMWRKYIEHITDRKIEYEESVKALQCTSKRAYDVSTIFVQINHM